MGFEGGVGRGGDIAFAGFAFNSMAAAFPPLIFAVGFAATFPRGFAEALSKALLK